MDPPIPVDWRPLDLVVKTDDGVVVRPIEERLRALRPSTVSETLPFVVWVRDPSAGGLEVKVLVKPPPIRQVTLAMKRFRCLTVDVAELPESDVKKGCAATLGFRYYDPAGRPLGKPLVGKRRLSRSCHMREIEKVWKKSFETRLKPWLKKMLGVYVRYDILDVKQAGLDRKLESKPDPERKLELLEEAARLRRERKEVEAEEAKVLAGCRLLPEFRPKPLAPSAKDTPR